MLLRRTALAPPFEDDVPGFVPDGDADLGTGFPFPKVRCRPDRRDPGKSGEGTDGKCGARRAERGGGDEGSAGDGGVSVMVAVRRGWRLGLRAFLFEED